MSVSTSLTERAASRAVEQGRARRRARLRAGLAVALVVALLGCLGWLVLVSGALGVRQVKVSGVARLTPDQVRGQATIEAGTPLARLDTGAVERRLAALAPVRSVAVDRRWPHTVEIRVRERVAAAVQPRGGSWVLVDRSGVEFATEPSRPRGLPLVSAPVHEGAAARRAALDVLDLLPAEVRAQVRQIRATTPQHVSLTLSRGRSVVWGSSERGQRKAAVLAVLLSRKASVYDVSAPDTPTTRR